MGLALATTGLRAVFTHGEARALGVSDRQLYRWREEGAVEVVARGIYARPELEADFDLVEIAVRAAEATLCLTTALVRHGLSDEIPGVIDVALPRPERQPRTAAPVRWHRFDVSTFGVGRDELVLAPGVTIGLYGPARSIVDAFRVRHLYGQDQAVEALKRWLRQPGNQPATLLRLAKMFPAVETPLRRTLEVLL